MTQFFNATSRKFIVTLIVVLMIFALIMYGKIAGDTGAWYIMGLCAAYGGFNIVDKKLGGKG